MGIFKLHPPQRLHFSCKDHIFYKKEKESPQGGHKILDKILNPVIMKKHCWNEICIKNTKLKSEPCRDLCTSVPIASLSTLSKAWRQCPLTDKWI